MPDLTEHGSHHASDRPAGAAPRDEGAIVGGARAHAALLDARVADVAAEWDVLAREEPWGALPDRERGEGIAELAHALVDTALRRRGDAHALRAALHAAADHGARRRAQGLSPDLLLREFGLLREALWRVLARAAEAARVPGELDAIYALDLAIAHATRAALFGAHRDALRARGAWPGVVDAIGEAAGDR